MIEKLQDYFATLQKTSPAKSQHLRVILIQRTARATAPGRLRCSSAPLERREPQTNAFAEEMIDNFFDYMEVWEIEPGVYEMREVGRGRKTVRHQNSRTTDLQEVRKRAYDIACVESDCRNDISD